MRRMWIAGSLMGLLCAAPLSAAQEADDPGVDFGPEVGQFSPGPGDFGMGRGPGRGGPGHGARGPGRERGFRSHRGMGLGPRMMEQLDLSEAQREKIQTVREDQQRKGIQMRADLAVARLDLQKLMRADSPDRRAIETQIDKVSRQRAALEKERVGAMLEMRSVLTAEQREKLRELRAERPAKRAPRARDRRGSD